MYTQSQSFLRVAFLSCGSRRIPCIRAFRWGLDYGQRLMTPASASVDDTGITIAKFSTSVMRNGFTSPPHPVRHAITLYRSGRANERIWLPEAIATRYWRPFTEYVIGDAFHGCPASKCHSVRPVLASAGQSSLPSRRRIPGCPRSKALRNRWLPALQSAVLPTRSYRSPYPLRGDTSRADSWGRPAAHTNPGPRGRCYVFHCHDIE